jgi:hypothetical protein
MEYSVSTGFIIMAIHPENGRIIIDNMHFRYALTGAVIMDFLANGEITLNDKKVIPSFRKNGVNYHDIFAEKIENSRNNKSISRWVQVLVRKSRLVFRENIDLLVNRGIIRHEKRYFLNIIPYNRYYFSNPEIRNQMINELREILLHDKQADKKQIMLIGLIKAAQAFRILAKERNEKYILKRKCNEYMARDVVASEIDKAIKQVQAEIIAAVTAATAAAHR